MTQFSAYSYDLERFSPNRKYIEILKFLTKIDFLNPSLCSILTKFGMVSFVVNSKDLERFRYNRMNRKHFPEHPVNVMYFRL